MKETTMKGKVLAGLFWKLMENGGVQGVQLVVSIVLARILDPAEYGTIALLTIFITIANVFIQQGFSTALIQKKNADDRDFSSVFFLSLGIAGVLYVILFFGAPLVADFYQEEILTRLLRVYALILFVGAIGSVENALVARKMQFRHLFISSLGAVLISGVIGIVMALMGAGVWALVAQQLFYQLLYAGILWVTVRWRPQLLFDLDRVKTLFSFGWKLLCSSLLDTLFNNIYGLVIGKTYNSEMLAYYDKGNQFPQIVVNNINGAIQAVMLPALSETQDNLERMKNMMRRSIKTGAYLVFPMMAGLMAIAEPMISLVLTDKWLPCVPFLRFMCLSYALWPVHTANLQAINAMGRSDIYLKLEILKQAVGVLLLIIGYPFGVYVMVMLKPVSSCIGAVINAWPNRRFLNYSIREQILDILPSAILSAVMGFLVYTIQFLGLGNLITIVLQLLAGVLIYAALSAVFKVETFRYLMATVKDYRNKGKAL